MQKRRGLVLFTFVLVGIMLIMPFASAGWFSDLFRGKVTGNVVSSSQGINIDFGVSTSTKSGAAAVSNGNYWNGVLGNGNVANLKYSDGISSSVGYAGSFGGRWSYGFGDNMMNPYMYSGNSITLSGISAGNYDLYLYGHGDQANQNTKFTVNGISKSTTNGASALTATWQENVQYVKFSNIAVSGNLIINVASGASSYYPVNGLQLVPVSSGGGGGGSATCTSFTYNDWSVCANSVQNRTVTSSSPSGCTGGSPVTSQACTVAPATCTSFTYNDWSVCANSVQNRTVTSSSPSGCTGGSPVTSQACTSTLSSVTAQIKITLYNNSNQNYGMRVFYSTDYPVSAFVYNESTNAVSPCTASTVQEQGYNVRAVNCPSVPLGENLVSVSVPGFSTQNVSMTLYGVGGFGGVYYGENTMFTKTVYLQNAIAISSDSFVPKTVGLGEWANVSDVIILNQTTKMNVSVQIVTNGTYGFSDDIVKFVNGSGANFDVKITNNGFGNITFYGIVYNVSYVSLDTGIKQVNLTLAGWNSSSTGGSGSSGPVCGNGVCESGETATGCASDCGGNTDVTTCIDTDGGKVYNVSGTTTALNGRSVDSCSGSKLTEYYCLPDGNGQGEIYDCDAGCVDGACIGSGSSGGGGGGSITGTACNSVGFRKSGNYCSDNSVFVLYKADDAVCENNFECAGNVCLDGKCVKVSFIQQVINWFRTLFGGG